MLTFQQAYLAMVEFLQAELAISGSNVDLRALLSELHIEASGTSGDPGAVLTFADAVLKVVDPEYAESYSHFRTPECIAEWSANAPRE